MKTDLQGLLSLPVNNIKHAQHFPLLIVNTVLSIFSTATFCQMNEGIVITGSSFQY